MRTWLRRRIDDMCAGYDDGDIDDTAVRSLGCCPMCRSTVSAESNVWSIFLENVGSARGVVCVNSDSE
jgi:hypothetical protein